MSLSSDLRRLKLALGNAVEMKGKDHADPTIFDSTSELTAT
jgi:hypothetical protein